MDLLLFRHKHSGVLTAEISEAEKPFYEACVIFNVNVIKDDSNKVSYSESTFMKLMSSSWIDIVEII